jgi:predicted heme/steroid binding protein
MVMRIRKIFQIISIVGLMLMISGVGHPTMARTQAAYTPGELAEFNGQNGARAYVAVNGLVYDLTNVSAWAQGRHYCSGAIAGKDITFLWNLVPSSHKNPNFLKQFPVVGKLVASHPSKESPTAPTPPTSRETPLWKIILEGIAIAVVITLVWLVLRLKK